MAYEKRFDGKADNYSAARPSYAEELVDFLMESIGAEKDAVIADVGCGTGKFSAQLLTRGCRVYGVEPNPGMGEKAIKALGEDTRFRIYPGNDAATGIPDASVDAITAAQAFHWFDPDAFRRECDRIKRPGGKIYLIWNLRDQRYAVNRDWTDLFREFAENFIGFNNGLVPDDPRIRKFFPEGYQYREFDNPLYFTREIFAKRLLSSSYAPMKGSERYEDFLARVDEIFERYQEDGRICVPHVSVVYWGE